MEFLEDRTAALSSPRKDVDMTQDDAGSAPMRGSQPVMAIVKSDEGALRIIVRQQRSEIERLKDAIRRIADQDATLSACAGEVTVQVDGTLSDHERKSIDRVIFLLNYQADELDKSGLYDYSASHRKDIAALRTLSERLG
jgi:hypothetical protein